MQGHPLETVIAEKTVTMLQRGTTSTRWRDLMDVATLARHSAFKATAIRTASHRGAELSPLRELMAGYGVMGQPRWAAGRVKNRFEDTAPTAKADQTPLPRRASPARVRHPQSHAALTRIRLASQSPTTGVNK